jgi:hypothetical protein
MERNIEDMQGISIEEVAVPTVGIPIEEVPVPQPHYRYKVDQPDVLLESIRDSVVSKSTLGCYIAEIFSLLCWLKAHQPQVLTTHGFFCIEQYYEESPGLTVKNLYQKYKKQFHGELRNAHTERFFEEELLTADLYMDYLSRQRHSRTGAFLSKSAYGVKKACAFHLFRLQNGSGFPPAFQSKITNLLRGFYRVLVDRRGVAQARVRATVANVAAAPAAIEGEVIPAAAGNDEIAQIILSQWNQVNLFLLFVSMLFIMY